MTTPIERRAAEIRMSVDPEVTRESAFLEEYLKWKREGGLAKYEAKKRAIWWREYRTRVSKQARREQPRT